MQLRQPRIRLPAIILLTCLHGSHASEGIFGTVATAVLNRLGLSKFTRYFGLKGEEDVMDLMSTTNAPHQADGRTIDIGSPVHSAGDEAEKDVDISRVEEALTDETLAFLKRSIGTAPDEGKVGKLLKEASVRSDSALEAAKSWTEYTQSVRDTKIPNFLDQAHRTRKVMGEEHARLVTDATSASRKALEENAPR
mmetsp:Transcript_36587/g.67052  ORF Transcript_36587/g.67052 Transcript_36587/m.67052 type:complete len:195 (+) Transcript_36587:122-706(+)